MQDLPNPAQKLLPIGKAAKALGVSIDTIRRWDKAGKIRIVRTPGGTRLIPFEEIEKARKKETARPLSIGQAAKELGVSVQTLRRWGKQGSIETARTVGGSRQFTAESIHKLKTQKPKKAPPAKIERPVPTPTTPVFVPPPPIQIVRPDARPTPEPVDISQYKLHQKAIHHIKHTRPDWYHRYHQRDWASTLHTVITILFAVLVGSLFLYTEVIRPMLDQTREQFAEELGDVLAAATPPRILSFQGRLTNASDVPITTSTNIVFRIWNHPTNSTEVACDGGGDEDCMWKSATRSVTPDQNGIFSVLLGDSGPGDPAIPATLFSEEAALYLGVTAGADSEMTPRQRIASVSYALNSDALEGFHGSQSPGADQVPILNGSGNFIFGGAATLGTASSGALILDSDSGTLTFGAGTNTLVNTDGATALLLDATGDLQFQSSSNYITSAGNLVVGGTFTASGSSASVGTGGNTFTFDTTSGPTYAGNARISKTSTLQPEYPGASLSVDDGTNNTGSMTSDVDTNNWRNYYEWSSSQASLNDYSVIVRFTLPEDFSAWQTSNAILVRYITEAAGTADNAVSVRINNEDDTPATPVVTKSDVANTSWAVITIDDSEIDDGGAPDWDAAGERAVIRIKLKSRNDNYARVGDIVLNYLAKF